MNIPPQAIAFANSEIEKTIYASQAPKKGTYCRYSPKEQVEISRYACRNGVAAKTRMFTRKLGQKVSNSTVMSIKKAYIQQKKAMDKAKGE